MKKYFLLSYIIFLILSIAYIFSQLLMNGAPFIHFLKESS